jgi:TolB-like protein
MEFVDGQTLESHIGGRPLDSTIIIDFGIQIADAFEAAHSKGIVYSDIKASNIMISPRGQVKILDIGTTRSNPEQQSDVFSLGVLLYQMSTGQLPSDDGIHFDSHVSADLERIIRKCLEKNPERRYSSVRELRNDLDRLRTAPPVKVVMPVETTPVAPAPRFSLRNWVPEAIIVLVAIGFAIQYWYARRYVMPESPSIVILPANVSGPAEMKFLSDAVSHTLFAALAGAPGIETKAPPSSIEFEQVGSDVKRTALAYDVNLVVATDIKAEGERFQLDVQVMDAVTQRVVWSSPFQGSRSEYRAMMHRAGEALIRALRPSAAAAAPVEIAGGVEAELAFREGEHHLDRYNNQHDVADFETSFKALSRALELNPQLANAAADISRLYGMKSEADGAATELLDEAEKWARRALEIDPRNGRAFFMLSVVDGWRSGGNPMARLENALRAAAFAPEYAPAHLDLGAAMAASANLGLAAARRSRNLDPLYLYAPLAEAGYLQQLGRVTEAFAILDRQVISVDPTMGYGRWAEASLMIELGWLDKAAPLVEAVENDVAAQRLTPLASNTIRQKFAIAQKQFGSAGLEINRILGVVNNPKVTNLEITVAVESVPTLARNGYVDEAFQILDRALATGAILPYDWLTADRRLDKLRKDGRLVPIVARSRAQFEAMLKVLEDARARGELPEYLQQPLSELRGQLGL